MPMKLRYRILMAIAVLGVALLYYFYPCLMLSIKNIPHNYSLNSDIEEIVLLYGKGICGSCPTGKFLNSLKYNEKVLFVVPEDYSENDIKNLIDAFNIQGRVIRGGKNTVNFLKNIAGCKRLKVWRNNYHITLNPDKKIRTIKNI